MTKKLLALVLTGALSLSLLAACASSGGGETPTATPTPAPTETLPPPPAESGPPSETVPPSETPAPAETPKPSVSVQPSETVKPTKQPAPGEKPALKPSPAPESPKPSETPAPIPEPTVSVVKSIWNQVSGLSRPALVDMDAALLSDLYGIEAGALEEFVAKMPAMSSSVSEFLIAKCAPGKVEAVKQACLDRQAALAADDRYPESVQLVKDYKLVTSGDYLLFAIDEHASAMVNAFNTFAK